MDLPQKLRSKFGVYDLQIDGVKVKATLVDPNNSSDQLETAISEFKSHIEANIPVVGVDFKPSSSSVNRHTCGLLLLHAKDRCLIIQLSLIIQFPARLGRFLSDKSICFVGLKIDEHLEKIRSNATDVAMGTIEEVRELFTLDELEEMARSPHHQRYDSGITGKGAEIRRLAAGVLKHPPLAECVGLFDLVTKTGLFEMKMPDETSKPSNWDAQFFTEDEIEYAVHARVLLLLQDGKEAAHHALVCSC